MIIDEVIDYKWEFGWDGLSGDRPKVNRLLKAMIEKNVDEMNRLFKCGAKLSSCDKETFARILFYVIDSYELVKCLVEHGFTSLDLDNEIKLKSVYDEKGYSWDLMARAWFLDAYDVVGLLAQNGFSGNYFYYEGETYNLITLSFIQDDIKLVKILLENGYDRREFDEKIEKYPNSVVSEFLINNPVVERKTVSLSSFLYRDYPKPNFKKPGLFNYKKVQKYNEYLLRNYNDFIRAQDKFIDLIGKKRWIDIKEKKEKDAALLNEAMIAVAFRNK